MGAAHRERDDMVYLFGRREHAVPLALLTEGMRRDIPVADTLPSSAIPFLGSRVALVLLIPLRLLLLMDRAEPTLRQLWAAGEAAGGLGLSGHSSHLPEIEKALGALHSKGSHNNAPPAEPGTHLFDDTSISHRNLKVVHDSTHFHFFKVIYWHKPDRNYYHTLFSFHDISSIIFSMPSRFETAIAPITESEGG